jgi:hypothetical protein
MAGLVRAIHVFLLIDVQSKTWMPATSAGMTNDGLRMFADTASEKAGQPIQSSHKLA